MEGERWVFKSWQLPFVVALLVVPVIAAIFLGGPPAGLGAAFIEAALVIVLAVRAKPDEEIKGAATGAGRLLVVATTPLDQPVALERIELVVDELGGPERVEVLVVAPATAGRLASWTSDLHAGRMAAADRVVVSLAALAAAGVNAHSRVGDADLVLATEDAIRVWPAEMILFIAEHGDDVAAAAAADVARRATVPVRHVALASATRAG